MVEQSYRTLLLAVILIGNLGLQAELLLLDHADSATQWIPHVTLVIGLLAIALVYSRPSRAAIRIFRFVMILFIAVGTLGLYLHYRGNVEFVLERLPSLGGLSLLGKALRGATPALAPGALAQLGLLGLLYAHRHPNLEMD